MSDTPRFDPSGAAVSILQLAHHVLGLRTSFIARTTKDRFLSVRVQDYGGCKLAEGKEFPLEDTYCKRTIQAGGPLLVPDALLDPEFARLPITQELKIRSYLGVPVYHADGSIYGTLCAIDPEPAAFSEAQVEQMQLLAQLLSHFLRRAPLTALSLP